MASYHSPAEWKDRPEWLAGRLDNRSRRLGYATYDGKHQQFTKSELVAFGSRIIAVVRALIGAGMSIFNDKAKLPNTEIPVRYIALDSSRPVGGTRCHGAFVAGSSDQLTVILECNDSRRILSNRDFEELQS